jgi:glycosyltransferase involved in cell wall biosynthesis
MNIYGSKPVISIIVPVYKVEQYLRRCIDSILAQTFINFECILIDDGSPDNCPVICDEYAEQDNRIVVIHQENKGVSAARNAGLDIAKGEWIGFVDSDDWCDEVMFQLLYENAIKYDVDVSICGARIVSAEHTCTNPLKEVKLICPGITATRMMFSEKLFNTNPFAKLMKAAIFIKNKIRYDTSIKYGEDALLLYEFYKFSDRVFYSSQPYYNYFRHSACITGVHELTAERKTIFMAYDKMLLSETGKTMMKAIKARKALEAGWMTTYYHLNRCFDNSYLLLRNVVKCNFIYTLTDLNISLKKKIILFFTLYPKLWRLVRGSLRLIKGRIV